MQQNAGHLYRMSTLYARLAFAISVLVSLALITCSSKAWPGFENHPTKARIISDIAVQQSDRINLIKRAPIPDMLLEVVGPGDYLEGLKAGELARRMETIELMHPNQPHFMFKEPMPPIERLNEPPLINHPIIQTLDRKRKIDHLELLESDEKVKKAEAKRDAILKVKPQRKSEKGKRVSELTMSNFSLAKAAVGKQFHKIQAIHSDNKFQKVVKQQQSEMT